jgi:predicted transcriptional regulator
MEINYTAPEIMSYVRKRLDETSGARRTLVMVTKIPYDTLAKIHQGVTENPRLQTVIPLLHALRYHEQHCRWPDVERPKRKRQARATTEAVATIGG